MRSQAGRTDQHPRQPGDRPPGLLLRRAVTLDGDQVDIQIAGGLIADVAPAGSLPAQGPERRLAGRALVLPALVEPHSHLTKTATGSALNPVGDFAGACAAGLPTGRTVGDVERAADQARQRMLAAGATALRTHVEIGASLDHGGLEVLRAFLALRDACRAEMDLQVFAFAISPLTGRAGEGNRAATLAALAAGADGVGACPWLDPDPVGSIDWCLRAAADAGVAVDLHMDETTDPEIFWLPNLLDVIEARGHTGPVAASHCCSLGLQPGPLLKRTVGRLAAHADHVGVIACPVTNLGLHERNKHTHQYRGLAPIRMLVEAGVPVAAGGDNVRDAFNPLGRGDPLEAFSWMVNAAHLAVPQALATVTTDARRILGLPPVALTPGAPADLVILTGSVPEEALANADQSRTVLHHGQVVAHTTVNATYPASIARTAASAASRDEPAAAVAR